MTQNKQSPGNNSRRSTHDWDETSNRNSEQDYRNERGSYDDDTQQRNAQGGSQRWNNTRGYQGDNYRNSNQDADYNQGSRFSNGNSYGNSNYGGREYGGGNSYGSSWNQRRDFDDRDNNSGNQDYRSRGFQGSGYDSSLPDNRNYDSTFRSQRGGNYGQDQYGSQTGRYNNQGRQYNNSDYEMNSYRQGGQGMDSNSYGAGTNYGMGTNYGANTNYGSGNYGSGANSNAGSMNVGRQGNLFGSHKGKGPKGYRRSDDRIKEDVNDRLSDDSQIDASDIEVDVDNGVVSLSGTVENRDVKRRAEDLVESISGVSNVENRLRVSKDSMNDKDQTNDRKSNSSSTYAGTNNDHKNKKATMA
jgi:osmotically-inducible protein OsmY